MIAGRAPGLALLQTAPARVDLRPQGPPACHQGPFRSCTGFAVSKGLAAFLLRRRGDTTPLSAMAVLEVGGAVAEARRGWDAI